MANIPIPEIPEEEQTPTIMLLLNIISQQAEIIKQQSLKIQLLEDEIARLKGKPPRPRISASTMDSNLSNKTKRNKKKRKNRRLKSVQVDRTIELKPDSVPEGSRFKGYRDFIVQDIQLSPFNINYKREKWLTPEGKYITASLPEGIHGHFGPNLKTFILYLNYGLNTTQPLIYEFLQLLGIQISKGMINAILTEDKEQFHEEKENILHTGLTLSDYVVVDDTGSRHNGKNGFCTHIGNHLFAYFKSSGRKNKINFLKLLRGQHDDYVINMDAYNYMKANGLSHFFLGRLKNAAIKGRILADDEQWNKFLKMIGISQKDQIRIVTEAALYASIVSHSFNENLVIVSDEAGQFNVFRHALCWIHAERKIKNIIPINDYQKEIIDTILDKLWRLYREIQLYQKKPDPVMKETLRYRFDELCTTQTDFDVINQALALLYKNKDGLLYALDRPEIPLNNNISENDIRSIVQKRKVHGGTRGVNGIVARDTFMSLKKTANKLGISFYEYLYDRVACKKNIPLLHEIIEKQVQSLG